ncbi:piggyBac transposable element-derived protein 4-like [Aricia agestis]|uniref:piggyBac transposable element-derived protein 4-like n=1 Tax=Aricia agestis TaxID=91739 RepID=UPI001C206F19|nr:piggyBac transposable element-derived protein 4-like [Aricia agestis]
MSVMETPVDEELRPASPLATEQSTELPHSLFDFSWQEFPNPPIPPETRRELFSNVNVGPTAPCVDPYDVFVAIWDRQFMEHIASETNRYAQQVVEETLRSNDLHPNSRIGRWCDTTADELYVYIGITIAMGVVVKSRLEEYWSSTADIFYTPGFSAYMSFNRFLILNKCLHFNNNEDTCGLNVSEAKLFKIKPVFVHLNSKFQNLYHLSQNISLDKSLLMWKELDSDQPIPNIKGIRTYEVCESQTGYLWRFEIHANKQSTPLQPEDPLNAPTLAIVLGLLHGLENKGHTVWMDNSFNSPILARRLKSLGFDCVGKLRTDCKFVPQALQSLTKWNMDRGQLVGLTSGDVDVMVWRDSTRVAMISTYHGNAVAQDRGIAKPISILDYNNMMGGVEKKDQMLAAYPIERKRSKFWYKKLFRRLLNVSVLNSFIIHKKSSPTSPLSHRSFRVKLVNLLLKKHCSRPVTSLPSVPPVTTQNVDVGPFDITHRLEEHPLRNGARKRRLCTVCKKRVWTFCIGCDKTVCKSSCFVSLHNSIDT